jgi:hypothetical protein
MNPVVVLGVIALLLSLAIKVIIERRKFYRRNFAGIEGFRSYSRWKFIIFAERLFRIVGRLLFLTGAALMLLWYFGR